MIKLITEFPVECKICGRVCCSLNSLSAHLIQTHDVKSIDYTLKYLLNDKIPVCKCGCNQNVRIGPYQYTSYINHHQIKTQYVELPHNPNDWSMNCDDCNRIMKYKTPTSYKGAVNRKKNNGKIFCTKCCQKGRKLDEDIKIERRIKLKKTWESKSTEEIQQYKKNLSESQFRRWENMSNEDLEKFSKTLKKMHEDMPEDKKLLKNKKISIKRKKWMAENMDGTFKTIYNKNTIPYIVDILNVRYNTEFRHAESEFGEFKVYDHELNCVYFADAYCKKLNIWIEFDEPYHFVKVGGRKILELKERCKKREDQIRKCLPEVQIHRIYFDNKIHKIKET